jgi:hypothetical protein
MYSRSICAAVTLVLVLASGRHASAQGNTDSAYAGVQSRGAEVMGVDQYTSHHVFEDLSDGGRIIFLRDDVTDSAGTSIIRAHLRTIADSFAAGVFNDPAQVHAREVPGTADMARLRDKIRYTVSERPGGGELRITTADPDARQAIHEFLAFQRQDHRAAGHEGMEHHHPPS